MEFRRVLFRSLMGTPDMRIERYPTMEQAAPLMPTMREEGAKVKALLMMDPEKMDDGQKAMRNTLEGFLFQGGQFPRIGRNGK